MRSRKIVARHLRKIAEGDRVFGMIGRAGMAGELDEKTNRLATHILERDHGRVVVDVTVEVRPEQHAIFFAHEISRVIGPVSLAIVTDPPLVADRPPDLDGNELRFEPLSRVLNPAHHVVAELR
jgi:hypothetical protein